MNAALCLQAKRGMEVLSRSRGKTTTCIPNPRGHGPIHHIKTTRPVVHWPSEHRLAGEQQRLVGEDGDAISETSWEELLEKDKLLSEEQEELRPPDGDETQVLHPTPQDKVSQDLPDALLDQDEELPHSFWTCPPLKETIELLKEQLSEANMVREREEEELRQSVRCIQETFKAELQMERELKHLLQEQLKEAKISHQQECGAHRHKFKNVQQQVENLQEKLEQEIKQKGHLQREVAELKQSLKYRQESLTAVLQVETKMKQLLQEQMQEARLSYQQDCTRYKAELINIQKQAENFTSRLQREFGQRTLDEERGRLAEPSRSVQESLEAELQAERKTTEVVREQLQEAKLLHQQDCVKFKAELEKFQQLTVHPPIQQEPQDKVLQKEQVEKLRPPLDSKEMKKLKKVYEEQLEEAKRSHQQECLEYRMEVENIQQLADKLKSRLEEEVRQKMLLQEEHQELKQNVGIPRETSKAELQAERLKRHLLQEQLEEAKLSSQQERLEHGAELRMVQQQVEHLKSELLRDDREQHQPHDFGQRVQEASKAEKQLLLQQLEEARLSHQQQCTRHETEINEVKQQAEAVKRGCDQRQSQTELHHQQQLEELQDALRQSQEQLRSMQQEESVRRQVLEKQLKDAETSCQGDCIRQNGNGLEEVLQELQGELQLLRQERDHLQHSLESSQEALASMLDSEKNVKQLHLEQLKEARLSHEEHCAKCRAEIKNLMQQSESLKLQLQREVQQRAVFQEVQEDMKQSLKYSQESLLFLLNTERERNQLLQEELSGVRRSFQQRCIKHKTDRADARPCTANPLRRANGLEVQQTEVKDMRAQKLLTRHSFFKKLFRILGPRFKQKASQRTLSKKGHRETSAVEPQGDRENYRLALFSTPQARAFQPDLQQGILQGTVLQKSQTVTQTWSQEELLPFHLWWNVERTVQSGPFEPLLALQPCYHDAVVGDQGQRASAEQLARDVGEEELDEEFFTPPDVLMPGLDWEFFRNLEGDENKTNSCPD